MDIYICVIFKSTSLKFSARFIDAKISIRQLHLSVYNSPGSLTDFARGCKRSLLTHRVDTSLSLGTPLL